jgi:predicted ester cyclase
MSSKNVETMRAAYESWNRRDFDAMVSEAAPTLSYTDRARNVSYKSPNEFKNFASGWAKAFPDAKITQPTFIDAGNTVIAQFTAVGTNTGPLGSLPPTGRKMTLLFCEICRFDSNGKMTGGDVYYDQLSMMAQLGHVKAPAAAA